MEQEIHQQTVVSVNKQYEKPIKRVGLVQSGHHHHHHHHHGVAANSLIWREATTTHSLTHVYSLAESNIYCVDNYCPHIS